MKAGKLEMPVSADDFSEILVSAYCMDEIVLDKDVMVRSSELPEIHKDPADRFIIATAFIKNCIIVTGDRRFPEYGVRTIS